MMISCDFKKYSYFLHFFYHIAIKKILFCVWKTEVMLKCILQVVYGAPKEIKN